MTTVMKQADRDWTYKLAMAAGCDAGNRHAQENERTTWDETDYAFAASEFNRLMGEKQ